MATLMVDLNKVPKKEFNAKRSRTGRCYHQLDFEVEISVQSKLEFSFSVNGKRYESITAKYE